MRESWSGQMVQTLMELRRDGVTDFEDAWRLALRRHPKRGVYPRPGFEDMTQFTEQVCRDAWTGARPALAAFTIELLGA